MTIEELKELRENSYQFKMFMEDRQLPATYEDRILELIDEKISQLSVTDEDVRGAIQKPDCESAEKCGDKCLGFGYSENDDEPIDVCKGCDKQVSYGED